MSLLGYKSDIFLFFLFFCLSNANGQVEEYLTSLPNIGSLVINQNHLYFNYNGNQEGNIIAVSDLSEQVASYSALTELDYRSAGLTIADSYLYYSVPDSGFICRINLLGSDFESEKVIEGLIFPASIVVAESSLYVYAHKDSLDLTPTLRSILKYDLSDVTSEPILVVDSLNLASMKTYRGDLIYSTIPDNCIYIYKDDIGTVQLLDCIIGPVNDIAVRNDELYTTETAFTYDSMGSINKLNLFDVGSGVVNVTRDVIGPTKLVADENYLYVFGSYVFGTIWRIELEEPSSISKGFNKDDIKIYPNPTVDFIHIEGEVFEGFQIFSITGQEVFSDKTTANQVDVSDLSAGHYLIKLDNGRVIQFQKINR